MKKEDKINAFKSLLGEKSQYGNYLAHLRSEKKWNTTNIEQTVKIAKEKIDSGIESFVIYGEPQCGKTAMMVGLTSKLIDDGHNLIIILLNDSLRLLRQNLDRFREVSLNPTPKKASDIDDKGLIDPKYVLFCKKNINDLKKLNLLVKGKRKVIIDDEADYASPNSNVNKEDKDPTAINNAIKRMIDDNCIYIGVTATPARLDLNNTFNNDNEQWVYYEPHRNYVGKEEFFLEDGHYKIKDVSRTDEEGDIQKAILSFIVNVININFQRQIEGKGVEKYCFLIHQHYKKKEHLKDRDIVTSIFTALSDRTHKKHNLLIKKICDQTKTNSNLNEIPSELIAEYVHQNISSNEIRIMNSDFDSHFEAINLSAQFTIFIGGNVVSRGVTFENLLGMFFTRAAKHTIQQDTYIQRARMFGNRREYLKYFELWIPSELYSQWQLCFIFHYISLESMKSTKAIPIWITGGKITPAAKASIDRKNIFVSKNEFSSEKFKFNEIKDQLKDLFSSSLSDFDKIKQLKRLFKFSGFIGVMATFIEKMSLGSKNNINFLPIRYVRRDSDYHDNLYRDGKEAMMGGRDYKEVNKDHHILIVVNENDEARLIYRYSPRRIRFMAKMGVANGN